MTELNEANISSFRRSVTETLRVFRPPLLMQLIYATVLVLMGTILAIWIISNHLAEGFGAELATRYGVEATVAHQMFMDSLRFAFLRVGGGAVLLAIAVSALLLSNILRPLREMTAQIERITSGDFSARINIANMPPRCEIRMLGAAQNKMAEKLEGLETLRRQMVSNLAHDLLTPLTNLRGYLEGLRDGVVEVTDDVFSMLEGEIRRLVRLVEDLHQLAIVDASKVKISFEKIDVEQLVRDASTIFAPEFNRKHLHLEINVEADAKTVKADREKLLRIIRNLVQNAVRYSEDSTAIKILSRKAGRHIELACENMGTEIPSSDIPYIFDRFYRAKTPERESDGGAGLGLAIVKELAEAHGGTVGAWSRDGMTVIWIRLPDMPQSGK